MPLNLVSTQEVAAMLDVAETTVKRWADEHIIPCVKTPGGHRKFPLNEIVRFAESKGYRIAGSQPPAMPQEQLDLLEIGIHTRKYDRIAEMFKGMALEAEREAILTLLLYLYKRHVPFTTIVDEIIRPAFESIGTDWEEGEVEINQEHAASQTTTESLIRMSAELHRKHTNGLSALCACPQDEFHEAGLRGLAYSLECEGWKVHYMGANTPAETLASFIKAAHPEFVCLSATVGGHRRELLDELRKLSSLVHSYHGKIMLGGSYAAKIQQHDIHCDHIAHSIQDAVAFSRDAFRLKPGPKKKPDRKQKSHR